MDHVFIKLQIPVTGAGGTAVLVVQEHGDMSRMRDGSFVLTTSSAINVPIELANVGVRYVKVVVFDGLS